MVLFPWVRGELSPEDELGESLDLVSADIRRRVAIKEALDSDLIAGRATLACVTDPGDTDLEKAAHNVTGFVEAELSSRPAEHREVVRNRLRDELTSLFPAAASNASR